MTDSEKTILKSEGRLELTPMTVEDREYLDAIQRATGVYDPNAIIGPGAHENTAEPNNREKRGEG